MVRQHKLQAAQQLRTLWGMGACGATNMKLAKIRITLQKMQANPRTFSIRFLAPSLTMSNASGRWSPGMLAVLRSYTRLMPSREPGPVITVKRFSCEGTARVLGGGMPLNW